MNDTTNQKSNPKPMTMADLMANYAPSTKSYSRGDEAEGKVIAVTDDEIVIDIGAKTEGVLNKRAANPQQIEGIKVGSILRAYVVSSDNEYGQIILSFEKQVGRLIPSGRMGQREMELARKWQKFTGARERGTKFQGRVLEVNRGGLVVEVDNIRGFLPSSHIAFDRLLNNPAHNGLDGLVGEQIEVVVIEVDPSSNRLVFSSRRQVDDQLKQKLSQFTEGQTVKGKIVGVLSSGLVIEIEGIEGVVPIHEVSWERVEDLPKLYKVGQEVEAKIVGIEGELGRINLSLKQLQQDPFTAAIEELSTDDVVKGVVTNITQNGVNIKLKQGVEGVLPSTKVETGIDYSIGQEVTVVIDTIDKDKHRITLAPFITSTVGLIYK